MADFLLSGESTGLDLVLNVATFWRQPVPFTAIRIDRIQERVGPSRGVFFDMGPWRGSTATGLNTPFARQQSDEGISQRWQKDILSYFIWEEAIAAGQITEVVPGLATDSSISPTSEHISGYGLPVPGLTVWANGALGGSVRPSSGMVYPRRR